MQPPTSDWFADDEDVPTATLRLDPDSAWLAERYPIRSSTRLDDGRLKVVLAVASERWFARLLLRLGVQAEVVQPPDWEALAARTAARVLARYRG